MYIMEIHDKNIIPFPISHQQNNDKRIKVNEDQDFCFCGGSEKSRFERLHKKPFKNFLEVFVVERNNFFFYKFLILLDIG